MNLKVLIIIFLILALAPVFMGKVSLPKISDFFASWDSFKLSAGKLISNDYNYYKSLATPWVDKLMNLIKEKIKGLF
ncbi:MAG: hypothetical protein Q7K28_01840 [Candidatus Wildermuthbacteria bacterium]|nr:hypothetical protein [Candidatus Wildermuthbacteria bacterium]